jgi:hypothetical protein
MTNRSRIASALTVRDALVLDGVVHDVIVEPTYLAGVVYIDVVSREGGDETTLQWAPSVRVEVL